MATNKLLATEALTKALRTRKRIGALPYESVCAIDAAEKLGLEVRLIDLPSMEGMYVGGLEPKIVLSSLRPQGRRSFTCAHEIGHHEFGHGEQFDELISEKSKSRKQDPNEFSADCFAGFFLMPKVAIDNGMSRRGFSYTSLTSVEAYKMANWLGVGYSTFINHLLYSVRLISAVKAEQLLRDQPRDIRQYFLGHSPSSELHLIDHHWIGRAIDCQVGDHLILPHGTTIERAQLFSAYEHPHGCWIQAKAPGIARASLNTCDWASFIRVSPSQYSGRSCYRFEEEVEE